MQDKSLYNKFPNPIVKMKNLLTLTLLFLASFCMATPPPEVQDYDLCDGVFGFITAIGENIKWYDEENNLLASGDIFAPFPLSHGQYILYATQTVDNVESEPARVNVTVKPVPNPPTLDQDRAICVLNKSGVISATHSLDVDIYWAVDDLSTTYGPSDTLIADLSNKDAGEITVYCWAEYNGCLGPSIQADFFLWPTPLTDFTYEKTIIEENNLNLCESSDEKTIVLYGRYRDKTDPPVITSFKPKFNLNNMWFNDTACSFTPKNIGYDEIAITIENTYCSIETILMVNV